MSGLFEKASHTIEVSPSKMWAIDGRVHAKAALVGATLFNFGDVNPSMEHSEFGRELLERGIFDLPFQKVAYECGAALFVAEKQGCDLAICVFVPTGAPIAPAVPLGIAVFGSLDVVGNRVSSDLKFVEVLDDVAMSKIYPNRADLEIRVRQSMIQVVALTVLLMSKGCSTDRKLAPAFINSRRVAKGKVPVPEKHQVTIHLDRSMDIASGNEYVDIKGFTHGSPRPHWRRGHFRTIHQGLPTERVVPVAPCIVGINDPSGVLRSNYRVDDGKHSEN